MQFVHIFGYIIVYTRWGLNLGPWCAWLEIMNTAAENERFGISILLQQKLFASFRDYIVLRQTAPLKGRNSSTFNWKELCGEPLWVLGSSSD